MRKIANRHAEFALFERILRGTEATRILLLEGPSERGKSILLAELAALAESVLGVQHCARADLKGGLALDDLFSALCADLGKDVFPTYTGLQRAKPLKVKIQADLAGATLGDDNKVSVNPAIHVPTTGSTQQRSEALLEDLRALRKPVALIIDTFESATNESSRWIVQQLLPVVRHNKELRIVLAGQRVPHPNHARLTWGPLAMHHPLEPVTSVDDWHEFARSRHPDFPRECIEFCCRGGLGNKPTIIAELVENIVRGLPPHNAGGLPS